MQNKLTLNDIIDSNILEKRKDDLDSMLNRINEKTTKLLNSDRSTIYIYDIIRKELWSKIAKNLEIYEIRLKIGEGIAGYAAKTKKLINIKDTYNNPYFNPHIDESTGYITKTLLATPLLNNDDEIIGVIEVINKKDGIFTEEDEKLITSISSLCAMAIEQGQLYEWNTVIRKYNEHIIRSISSGLVVTDKDFRINLINSAAKQIFAPFGINLKENILTENILFSKIPDTFQSDLNKKGIAKIDKLEIQFEGLTMFFNIKASKLVESEQENYGYILLFDDITEKVLLEIEKTQKEATSLIGKMASSIIHDIKNPLAIIKSYVQLTERNIIKEERSMNVEQIQHYYGIINSEINRLVSMTEEVLRFVKGEYKVNIEKCNIEEFVNNIKYHIIKLLSEKSITLNINLKYKGNINIDKDKLTRLFYNIAYNANDAMSEKGTFEISLYKENNYLKIHFKDNGKGIPPQIQKDIFMPFTTFNKQKGIGLGMAIVKKIVDEHNGNILVESEENKGTKIIIAIPFQLPI